MTGGLTDQRFKIEDPYMKNLIKKNLGIIIVVLMLGWTVSNVFVLPQIAAAGIFCAVMVPTVNAVAGKKYGIPLAVVGFVWFVITIIMHFR